MSSFFTQLPLDDQEILPSVNRRRKRNEKIAIFLVIFLVIFTFSSLAWYFHANPNFDPSKCGKRLIGYYKGWGNEKIPEIPFKKLTHVIFSSAGMDKSGNLKFQNELRERSFLEFREKSRKENPDLKVMVAIGNGPLPPLDFLVEPEIRNGTFITSILQFIERYEIDGIEIQWKKFPKEETLHKLKVIKNLREALKSRNRPFLLSLSLPYSGPDYGSLDDILDLFDFINVQSFDFSNSSPGPFAPLGSVDRTMKLLVCQTEKWNKINMGIGFYGRIWKNETFGNFVKFRDIEVFNSNFFENEQSVLEKTKYAIDKNFGGIAISMLNFDDDKNSLLNAVTSVDLCSGFDSGEASKSANFKCDELFVNI